MSLVFSMNKSLRINKHEIAFNAKMHDRFQTFAYFHQQKRLLVYSIEFYTYYIKVKMY